MKHIMLRAILHFIFKKMLKLIV